MPRSSVRILALLPQPAAVKIFTMGFITKGWGTSPASIEPRGWQSLTSPYVMGKKIQSIYENKDSFLPSYPPTRCRFRTSAEKRREPASLFRAPHAVQGSDKGLSFLFSLATTGIILRREGGREEGLSNRPGL